MGVHLISWKITDAAGAAKSIVMQCADTETYANIALFVLQVDSLLDAVVDVVITSATVAMNCPIDGGLDETPEDDMLVGDGGVMGFAVTGSAYRTSMFIPTVKLNLIGNDRDIANAGATAALITALLSETNIALTDKHENVLASFLSGTRRSRK